VLVFTGISQPFPQLRKAGAHLTPLIFNPEAHGKSTNDPISMLDVFAHLRAIDNTKWPCFGTSRPQRSVSK
jgi:hypothetical protein